MVISQRCLVVGGSSVAGSEICKVLHRKGCPVAFTYCHNQTMAKHLTQTLEGTLSLFCNLKKSTTIQKVIERVKKELGGLDSLIYAVGIASNKSIHREQNQRLQKMPDVASDKTFNLDSFCQATIPLLQQKETSNIVVIEMNDIEPASSLARFATAKMTLNSTVEAMSKGLGQYNICVNFVVSGILEKGVSAKMTKGYLAHHAIQRFAIVREIAEVASWFALENTYITGQTILLPGERRIDV